MNIFVLDENPVIAAQMLCDRHVSKMILETAQMLSAVADRYGHPTIYKPSHVNHPCTLWAGDSRDNWLWLITHGLAMADEKRRRTGKGHMSESVIRYYYENNFGPPEDIVGITPFAQAMPNIYKRADAVEAYREYYLNDKQFFKDGRRPTWNNATPPEWWHFK